MFSICGIFVKVFIILLNIIAVINNIINSKVIVNNGGSEDIHKDKIVDYDIE